MSAQSITLTDFVAAKTMQC